MDLTWSFCTFKDKNKVFSSTTPGAVSRTCINTPSPIYFMLDFCIKIKPDVLASDRELQ